MRVSQIYHSKKARESILKKNPEYYKEVYRRNKKKHILFQTMLRKRYNEDFKILNIKKNPFKDKIWNKLSDKEQKDELMRIIDDIYGNRRV